MQNIICELGAYFLYLHILFESEAEIKQNTDLKKVPSNLRRIISRMANLLFTINYTFFSKISHRFILLGRIGEFFNVILRGEVKLTQVYS